MRKTHGIFVAVLLLTLALHHAAAADVVLTAEEVARQVQAVLWVPDTGSAGLDELASLIDRMNSDPRGLTTAGLTRLASALEGGIVPGALSRRIMKRVKASTASHLADDFVKPYGTKAQRAQIIEAMRDAVDKDAGLPDSTKRSLARGAIVLAAQDQFCRHPSVITELLEDGSLAARAGLDARAVAAMRRACDADPAGLRDDLVLLETLNALCDEKDPDRQRELTAAFVASLSDSWSRRCSYANQGRWTIAHRTWLFKCLLTARRDAAGLVALKDRVAQLKRTTTDLDEQRWLDEAINTPGPAPRRGEAGIIIRNPNDTKPKRG